MPTPHDAVPALPVGSDAVKQLLRDLLFERMAYVMTAAENHADFVETDPASGAITLAIVKNGKIYYFDPADTTTPNDGITCLVTSGGKRYKLEDFVAPFSVIDKDLTAPPSPAASIGDAYLLMAPGTGLWAGLGPVVVLTGQGWVSVDPPVGFMIYVEDEDSYYHVDENGDVVSGLGSASISEGALFPVHLLRGGDLVHWLVINQTTTVPPSSPAPTEGDTYIAGVASTGAWTGWDGSIVRYENGSWRRYIPSTGWRATDLSLGVVIAYQSPNWVSQAGAIIFHDYEYTEGTGTITDQTGGSNYSYSDGTAPTTSHDARIDDVTLTRAARKIGAKLRFSYTFRPGDGTRMTMGLFRDAEASAIRWYHSQGGSTNVMINATFLIEAGDVASHVYHMRVIEESGLGHPPLMAKRLFQIEEFS